MALDLLSVMTVVTKGELKTYVLLMQIKTYIKFSTPNSNFVGYRISISIRIFLFDADCMEFL